MDEPREPTVGRGNAQQLHQSCQRIAIASATNTRGSEWIECGGSRRQHQQPTNGEHTFTSATIGPETGAGLSATAHCSNAVGPANGDSSSAPESGSSSVRILDWQRRLWKSIQWRVTELRADT